MKTCKRCGQEKELSEFCNRKDTKDGLHRYCKQCMKKETDDYYQTSGRKESDYYRNYQEENRDYFREKSKIHYHSNKELYREWNRAKRKTDIEFRIKHIVNSRINSAIKTFNSLKTDKTIEYLGCSIGEYVIYLEAKFDENMSWDNYGEYWQIDHIKPIASFNLNNEDELYLCFHHSNTQPLEKTENRFKSDKYIP